MRRLILACLAMLGALFGASVALVASEAYAQPMCLPNGDAALRCYAVTPDIALWRINYSGETWGPWQSQGGAVVGEIDCMTAGFRQDCFARGPSGTIVQRVMSSSEPVRWDDIGGSASGSPSCFYFSSNFDCFVRGTDNALWRRSGYIGRGWSDWNSGGGVLTGDPECVAQRTSGRFDCMVRNTEGGLSHIACVRGSPCAGWVNLDGVLNSRLSCVIEGTRGTFRPFVCFVRGTDNALHSRRYDGTWGPWQRVNEAPFNYDPACVSLADGDIACYAHRSPAQIWSIRRVAGAWGEWTLTTNTVAIMGTPRCFHRTTIGVTTCVGQTPQRRMALVNIPNEGAATELRPDNDLVLRPLR